MSRETRMVPDSVINRSSDKPAIQQIVIDLFYQLPLTAYAIKYLEQLRSDQALGGDGFTPIVRINTGE